MTTYIANRTSLVPPERKVPVASSVDDGPGVLVAHPRECPPDRVIDWHTHSRAQLLYAVSGVMRVATEAGVWIVPPQRAVWIPPGIEHQVQAQGTPLSMRSLYFHPDVLEKLPKECCVVSVSPLLRELITTLSQLGKSPPDDGPSGRLVQVLLDQIEAVRVQPLHLPIPTDKRLASIAGTLLDDPADNRTLADWTAETGASERTLARLFKSDTGMSFGRWRQQVRLMSALARLARGDNVTVVALDLGYASQSAFIAMFRRALGRTPGRYFSDLGKDAAA